MTPLAIARTRPPDDQPAFLMAFTAATQADRWDIDLEGLIAQALREEQHAKVAGLLEGIAAVHAAAGMPMEPSMDWRRRHRNSLGRFARGGVA